MNGTHEIIELTESYDFESKNRGKQQAIKKHSIEDDINKLFEAIGRSERHGGDLHKSAMKRPMRVSPEIGISESTSLKQALRGLCISQASEMAAVKKRMLSLSASPAPIKKTLKIEARDSVQNFNVENELIKGSKRGFSTIGRSLRAHNVANRKILPQIAFATKSFGQQNGGKIDQESGTVASSSSSCKTKSLSPNFIVEDELIKSTERDFGTIERRLTAHNVAIRKMLPQIAKIDQDSSSSCKTKSVEFSQSSKSSIGEYSTTTSYSEESYLSGSSRPHMSKDVRWEAISVVQKREGILGMKDFKLLRKIGGGDIGTVYLSELIGTSCLFAVKVMDNEFLGNRKKMHRAQTEKEILEILDHPFLPTLYVHFRTRKYSCLVMEYCPGGDLHVLRQKQPTRSFSEKAARFYAAEILLALEYLHMLGVVYRDLKPENILVREDGHIMLSDFDLSLRCAVNPTLLSSSSPVSHPPKKTSTPFSNSSCIDPFCLKPSFQLSCFLTKTRKLKTELATQVLPLPQLVVEPITARSNSFVGTHEYLAPEIIKGEGHGSAVDWWTFGIFLYELLHGKTPYKGTSNEETISNVVSESLKFPECSMASSHARDLIHGLLKKEPENRLGFAKGATEIKKHPFFEGLNWALIRCETPPEMPRWFDLEKVVPDKGSDRVSKKGKYMGALEFENERDEMEFEMF